MLNATEDRDDERRAQYPDAIRLRLPRGFRAFVKQAAQAERIPTSEFIRRAIGERIKRLTDGGNGGLSFGAGA